MKSHEKRFSRKTNEKLFWDVNMHTARAGSAVGSVRFFQLPIGSGPVLRDV